MSYQLLYACSKADEKVQKPNEEMLKNFDGHANCFLETGYKKGILLDFNYDVQPVPGKFPIPWLGPLSLLKETRLNHLYKMFFKWIYWFFVVKGRRIMFISSKMSKSGKKLNIMEEKNG